jgi:putative membrane protein insertion efficiency factor
VSPHLRRWINLPFVVVIRAYQITLSPIFGRGCRYEPTCSHFGLAAYRTYGPLRATWLTAARVLRCHPFARGGYDPLPLPDSVAPAAQEQHASEK